MPLGRKAVRLRMPGRHQSEAGLGPTNVLPITRGVIRVPGVASPQTMVKAEEKIAPCH